MVRKYLKGIIVDIGCGVGIESNFIQHISDFAVGIDIDSDLLKISKNIIHSEKLDLIAGDAYKLPFKKRSFDIIVMFD
ncbi:MAG: methyltransferase domain-containing protein, partial [Promethearchaeota archaeon]